MNFKNVTFVFRYCVHALIYNNSYGYNNNSIGNGNGNGNINNNTNNTTLFINVIVIRYSEYYG